MHFLSPTRKPTTSPVHFFLFYFGRSIPNRFILILYHTRQFSVPLTQKPTKQKKKFFYLTWDRIVGTVTRLRIRWTLGSFPGRCRKFISLPKRQDRLWSPFHHAYNGYGLGGIFTGRQNAWGMKVTTYFHQVSSLGMNEAVLSFPHIRPWRAHERIYLLPLHSLKNL